MGSNSATADQTQFDCNPIDLQTIEGETGNDRAIGSIRNVQDQMELGKLAKNSRMGESDQMTERQFLCQKLGELVL
jgi:hypothetical protein